MTPLSVASSASPTPPPGARSDKAASGSAERNAFARALERRQDARAGADAARAPGDDPTVDAAPDPATSPGAGDRAEQAPMDSPSTAIVDVQQPAPAWPPVGLAGLLGFADDAVPPEASAPAGPEAEPRPLSPGGALPATAPPMPAAAPPSALAFPQAALPDVDAAPPPPPFAVDTAAPVEGADPVPVAFALPSTAALREPAPMLAAPLPAPEVGADDFEARFGAQLEWMADQKIGHARIRVTPHDLGPVEVRLHMDGDRIRAEFVAAQAETRQALEQGLPRLRDLLGEHGFQLAHAGVGGGNAGEPDTGAGNPSPAAVAASPAAGFEADTTSPRAVHLTRGLLDAYA